MLEIISKCIVSINGNLVNYNEVRSKVKNIPEKILASIYTEYSKLKEEVNNVIDDGTDIKN